MRRNIRVAVSENARDLGTLRFDAQGARESAAFAYDAEWLGAGDGFAIDPALSLVTGPQFHRRERGGSVFQGAIADTEELWRRIAFSILITNVDDHLRNHGFLHADRGQWRLAPAFDVNPFPDRVRELKTWVSEDTGPDATIESLMSVLPYFRIALPRAQQILRELEQAVSRWRYVGRGLGMTTQELDQFADAFEHEERAVARTASQ